MMHSVWVWQQDDCYVGGGGATVKLYSSAEKAIAANPGDWHEVEVGLSWVDRSADRYEPIGLHLQEVDEDNAKHRSTS